MQEIKYLVHYTNGVINFVLIKNYTNAAYDFI